MATTTITLNVDNTILQSAIAALDWKNGWSAQVTNSQGQLVTNPITAGKAAKSQLIAYVESCMVDYQNMLASQSVTGPTAGLIS